MQYVAVVDIGKTNAKLAVVDVRSRQEVDVLTTPNIVINAAPYPHFDTDLLWAFLIESLREFSARFTISAISITTHGACVTLLDNHGQLATPVLDYEHDGPNQSSTGYLNIRPSFQSTGSPRLPGGLNAGAQLHWLFEQDPKLHNRVKTIVMYPQYWAHRLCGVLANEPTSLGCHTDLWDPVAGDYSTLVDALNIQSKMAEVRLPSDRLGRILPDVAKTTGLDFETIVYCGIHDSNASLYPHLVDMEPPFSVVSTGTWVVCMAPGSDTTTLDEHRDTLLNVSAFGNPTPSSRFMGGREYDYLVHTYAAQKPAAHNTAAHNTAAHKTETVIQSVLDREAFILPAVELSSGPYQHRQYQWTVDPEMLSPEERYHVISFYLAMMTDTCLTLCHATGNIIIEGPFADNQPYCAMLSAATNRTILVNDGNSTGTSVGAAMLAVDQSDSGTANSYRVLISPDAVRHLNNYCHSWRLSAHTHKSTVQTG